MIAELRDEFLNYQEQNMIKGGIRMSYKSERTKRRIEEIRDKALKDKVQFQNIRTGKNGWVNTYTLAEDDFNFLVKKAGRVEELEQQNKRYREAIEKIKKKISKQLEGLDAEEEMQRVMELSELMTMAVGSLKEENFNLTQTTEQLDLFGEESE